MENSKGNIRLLEIQTRMANIQVIEGHGRNSGENIKEKISY